MGGGGYITWKADDDESLSLRTADCEDLLSLQNSVFSKKGLI